MRYGITVKANGEHLFTTSVRTITDAEKGDELYETLSYMADCYGQRNAVETEVTRWVSDSYDTRRAEVKEIACTFVEYELPVMGDEAEAEADEDAPYASGWMSGTEDAEDVEQMEARDEELEG